MTQVEIAKKLGVTQQAISAYINGRQDLRWSTAERWAEELGIKPEDLLKTKEKGGRETLLGLS